MIEGATTTSIFISFYKTTTEFKNGSINFQANFEWDLNDMVLLNGAWTKISELAVTDATISEDSKTLTLTNVNTTSEVRGRASTNIVQGQTYEVTMTVDADGSSNQYSPVSQKLPVSMK
ncbi:hypothetical protein [Cytobacillus gottheilii]|uniref:Uncharacterized protein n=1 Tax=Cytobacillus gottheilii TaxID=859144 RepID=A0ABX8FB51_9BACI|nr:hypothetical protein [Cytobacillus gottheilii]QVY61254.1 hypothetical protein J1899_20210 [Cytobacillus gottheilii]